ncbi:MAG: nitroreductase family protein [Armatimonadetes bacterium]|nr:nitroreductase family protein [Armatimonadota bacterium]
MELFEAIAERYSYRGEYTGQSVPREHLQQILQAGLAAPSGCNSQSTRFVAVDDPALLSQISDLLPPRNASRTAQAMIFAVVDAKAPAVYEDMSFQVEDCAAAVQNMLLAITALGYASVWIDGVLRVENRAQKIGALLGVPASKVVRIMLPIGVPVEAGPRREKLPFDERAWFNRYEA